MGIGRISCWILLIFLLACKGGSKENDELGLPVDEGSEAMAVDDQSMEGIVENVSSPIEMAALIKELGVPFSKKYLASTEDVDNIFSSSKKAFNLGIFGADMGYLNMYNKTTAVVDYLSAIKKLADGIQVGQFFDFSTLKRLATNNENIDSLMYISVHSFNQMDKFLRKNKRGNLSALMIAGVWIEGLYLATQVAAETKNPQLAERIGEQKIVIGDLILILSNYKNDKFIKEAIKDLEEIKAMFNEIKITYEMGESEMIERDGMLVIVQNEKSIVHITDAQLDALIKKTEEVRNRLISI